MPRVVTAQVERPNRAPVTGEIANLTPTSVFLKTDEPLRFREVVMLFLFEHRVLAQVVFNTLEKPAGAVLVFDAPGPLKASIAKRLEDVEIIDRAADVQLPHQPWAEATNPGFLKSTDTEPGVSAHGLDELPILPPEEEAPAIAAAEAARALAGVASRAAPARTASTASSGAPLAPAQPATPGLPAIAARAPAPRTSSAAGLPRPQPPRPSGVSSDLPRPAAPAKSGLPAPRATSSISGPVARASSSAGAPMPTPRAGSVSAPAPARTSSQLSPPPRPTSPPPAATPPAPAPQTDREATPPAESKPAPSQESGPAELPTLDSDGVTLRFATHEQFRAQYRANVQHGGLIARSTPIPIGTQRFLGLEVPGKERYTVSVRVTFIGEGMVGFGIDSFTIHKNPLRAMVD